MSEREAYWRQVIQKQPSSGLTVNKFCEREGVSTASFFAWRKRLATEAAPMFLPVNVVEPIRQGPAIELERTDGTLLRIFDGARRQTLIDVLAALAGASA
jgi:transposase